MKRMLQTSAGLLACWMVVGWAANLYAADRATEKVAAGPTTYRASKLIGMNVRNPEGEKVGTVDDLVMDLSTGKISYVALGFGGVLGIGEKLFAVPFSQLKVGHDKDETFFVLNVDRDKLKAAPGFDKRHWPDLADPKWSEHIDQYYRSAETDRPTDVRTKATK